MCVCVCLFVCLFVCVRRVGGCLLNEKTLLCHWSRLQLELGIVGDITTTESIKKIIELQIRNCRPGPWLTPQPQPQVESVASR